MKKVLFMAALVAASFTGTAQDKKLSFGLGAELALPMGDFGTFYSFGAGVSAQMNYAVTSNVGLTLNAGYVSYSGKSGAGSSGVIPVLAGVSFNLSDKVYASGQLGMTMSAESGGGSAFTFAPGVGYKVSDKFDLLLKYSSWSDNGFTSSALGLRAGFTF